MSILLRALKTLVWNTGAFLFFAGLVVSSILYTSSYFIFKVADLCETTQVQELTSPNRKKVASIRYSDCGGTTNWQSGLQIEDSASGKVFNELFGLDGKPDSIVLRWENDHTLVISGFAMEKVLWFKQDYFSGAKVVHKP